MRVLIFLFLFVAGSFNVADPDIEQIRALSEKAPLDEDACELLIEILEPYDTSRPLLYGYKGIATMIMAKHVFSPFKRLSYFNKGKEMLAEAILADPSNVELRYLRFSAQTKAPGFLGYKDHLDEDRIFLIKNLPTFEQGEMKTKIKQFLLNVESTTGKEKEQIKSIRNK